MLPSLKAEDVFASIDVGVEIKVLMEGMEEGVKSLQTAKDTWINTNGDFFNVVFGNEKIGTWTRGGSTRGGFKGLQ